MSVKKKQTQTKEKKRLFDRNTRRLIRSMKPIRGWLTLSAMLCAVLIGCAVAAPQILGDLIDRLYTDTKSGSDQIVAHLLPGLGVLLALYALNAVVTYGNSYLLNTVVTRFYTAGLRVRLSEKLGKLPVSYMDKTPFGDVIDRMMDDVGSMSSIVYNLIEVLMTGFLQMLVIAVFLFFEDWHLALVVVVLSPLSVFLSGKLASLSEKYWHKHFNLGGELFALAEESFTNYPVTKAFNRENAMKEKYAAKYGLAMFVMAEDLKAVADVVGAEGIDMYPATAESARKEDWPDQTHPPPSGHRVIAEVIFKSLKNNVNERNKNDGAPSKALQN